MANENYLPTKIGWFRLPEHVQAVSDRVDALESAPVVAATLQAVTDAGNTTNNNIEVENNTQKWIQVTNVGFTRGVYMDSQGYLNTNYDGKYIDIDPNAFEMYWSTAASDLLTIGALHTDNRSINFPDADGTITVQVAVPASASATGLPGQIAFDASFAYFCTAVDTWVRVPLATW